MLIWHDMTIVYCRITTHNNINNNNSSSSIAYFVRQGPGNVAQVAVLQKVRWALVTELANGSNNSGAHVRGDIAVTGCKDVLVHLQVVPAYDDAWGHLFRNVNT